MYSQPGTTFIVASGSECTHGWAVDGTVGPAYIADVLMPPCIAQHIKQLSAI